jgi:hypothetical protein
MMVIFERSIIPSRIDRQKDGDAMTEKTLRRYTSIPAVLHLLRNKKITLLDPSLWDDKNDTYFMNVYKRRKKLKTLLALCFARTFETYHHWRVFTKGEEGICIIFDEQLLMQKLTETKGLRWNDAVYMEIKEIKASPPRLDQLPFIKRFPYRDEKEVRILYEDDSKSLESMDFDIDLDSIKRITLNPWIPPTLAKSVKDTLHEIQHCAGLKITRTTLRENIQWRRAVESYHVPG